jgi:hypothetical protein
VKHSSIGCNEGAYPAKRSLSNLSRPGNSIDAASPAHGYEETSLHRPQHVQGELEETSGSNALASRLEVGIKALTEQTNVLTRAI